jgi:hypothetical protein
MEPLVRTKTRVSDAHYSGLTQPKCPGWRRPRQPRRPTTRGKDQGWLGEVAAIKTTLAAAAQKLEVMRAVCSATIHLGMPDIRAATGRSSQG